MKNKLFSIIGTAALLLATSNAQAAVISYTSTIAQAKTNWNTAVPGPTVPLPLTLTGFDTLGGTLTLLSAVITFTSDIISTTKVESLDAAPSTVTATASGNVTFSNLPNAAASLILLPTLSQSIGLTAFDGVIDFAGTSGFTFLPITATASGTKSYSLPADLSFFSTLGLGTFNINVATVATSGATGAGNLVTQINTTGGAAATIVYTYLPTVLIPTPGTMALLGLGLLGLAGMRRKAML